MKMSCLWSLFMYGAVLLFSCKMEMAEGEGVINLLPNWNPTSNAEQAAATTTAKTGTNCAASLDVQTSGNRNCPAEEQYFDIQSCQFVCDSPKLTTRKSSLT